MDEALLQAFEDELAKIAESSDIMRAERAKARRRANYLFSERAGKGKWSTVPRNAASEPYVEAIEGNDAADSKLRMHVRSLFNLSRGQPVGKVESSSGKGKTYEVRELPNGGYGCTCNDWRYRGTVTPGYECKHIRAHKQGQIKAASVARASSRVMDRLAEKLTDMVEEKERDAYKRTGRPYSTLLTQGEEPTDYHPLNPVPDDVQYILGR
jgi:hypothetical protein